MIKDKTIPDVSLEYMPLYINIERSTITKVATCPELFMCAEVIGWILSQTDVATLVVNNTEKKGFASFIPAYIAKACKLSALQGFMTDKWI